MVYTKKSNNIVWFPFSFEPYCGFALDQFGYWSCKNRQRFSTSSMWRQVEFISDGGYLQTLCVQVNRMHEVKGLGRWISYVSSLKESVFIGPASSLASHWWGEKDYETHQCQERIKVIKTWIDWTTLWDEPNWTEYRDKGVPRPTRFFLVF
jgi:hypothetical protein